MVERGRARASDVMVLLDRVTIEPHPTSRSKQHLVALDAGVLETAVAALQQAVEEMRPGSPVDGVDTGGSYRTDANEFVAKSILIARAIRTNEALSRSDAASLMNAAITEYNELIGDYNRLQ